MLKIAFLIKGSINDNRGTPIRIRNLITGFLGNGCSVSCSSSERVNEINDPNFLDLAIPSESVKSADAVLVLNANGLWEHRKYLYKFDKTIICDLHSLRSIELASHSIRASLKSLLIEIWALIFIWKKRVICLSVNRNLLKLLCLRKKRGIWFPASTGHIDSVEELKYDSQFTIYYSGNLRRYQGVEFLINSFQEINSLREFKLEVCTSDNPSDLELFEQQDIELLLNYKPLEALESCAKAHVAIVPRRRSFSTLLTFPSKLVEYLGCGTLVVASSSAPMLPPELEQYVVRYKTGNQLSLTESLEKTKDLILNSKSLREKQLNEVLTNWTYDKLTQRICLMIEGNQDETK
jgi:glycosyltransferase involved in cell wall biosynthesis